MMSLSWIITSMLLIFLILIHNPKAQNVAGQTQLFVSTRSSEATLNKLTWMLIIMFFSLATYMAIINKLE